MGMALGEETMKCFIEKNENIRTKIILEEYIPLEVMCKRKEEPVDSVTYSKDATSCLDVTIGVRSGLIHRIVLLLSKRFNILNENLTIDMPEKGDLKFENIANVTCTNFMSYLYKNGIKIVFSNEKSYKYVRMDKLYVGLSSYNEITEICLCPLNIMEVAHIRNELEFQ